MSDRTTAYTSTDDSVSSGSKYLYTWLTGNMHRTYPLRDTCTGVSTSGYVLPQSLLIDMSIIHKPMDAAGSFFISRIDVDGNGVRLTLAFQPENSSGEASGTAVDCARTQYISGTLSVDTLDYSETSTSHTFSFYRLPLSTTDAENYPGLLELAASAVIGTCSDMNTYGSFMFTSTTAAIERTRVIATVIGIQEIVVKNVATVSGTEVETDVATINDSFTMRAGDGITFVHSTATDSSGNTTDIITVKRTKTAEETAAVQTVKEAVEEIIRLFGQPIMTINGVAPSLYLEPGSTVTYPHNIQLKGLDCTEIKSSESGVTISNPCAKPCCDTTTPSDVKSALASLDAAKSRLESYYSSLMTNMNAMQARLASLIASRT